MAFCGALWHQMALDGIEALLHCIRQPEMQYHMMLSLMSKGVLKRPEVNAKLSIFSGLHSMPHGIE